MKIKIDLKKVKKISFFFAKYRYLLFTLFFCSSLVYSFQVIYDYAYSNIRYVNYTENEGNLISEAKTINRRMQIIIENIENRNNKFDSRPDLEYVNPLRYNMKKIEVKNLDFENNNNSIIIEDKNIEISEDL